MSFKYGKNLIWGTIINRNIFDYYVGFSKKVNFLDWLPAF